jgi:hypothetical protein
VRELAVNAAACASVHRFGLDEMGNGGAAVQGALASFLVASRAAFAASDDPCGVLSANDDIRAPRMRVGWPEPGAMAAPGFFLGRLTLLKGGCSSYVAARFHGHAPSVVTRTTSASGIRVRPATLISRSFPSAANL